ncbi:MAG: hypothetical protein HHAS10_07710 [Candidatus Altimarinota bacterium]
MRKIFDSKIFDGIEITSQIEFESFCRKHSEFCKSYLRAGIKNTYRNEYEEIYQSFGEIFPVKGIIEEVSRNDEKFTQRFWELEIYNALRKISGSLNRTKQGVDFKFLPQGYSAFIDIECVAPGRGTGKTSIAEYDNYMKVQISPPDIDERVVLRIIKKIDEKLKHKNQTFSCTRPYIIAINTANLPWEFHTKRIYQTLFALKYPLSNNPLRWWSEKNVKLGYFATDKYKYISAIIYSNCHPNEYREGNPNRRHLYMIHNPFAQFPINRVTFPFFQHVLFNPETLEIIDETSDPNDIPEGTIINF